VVLKANRSLEYSVTVQGENNTVSLSRPWDSVPPCVILEVN
jgi:hypothetical protein